MPPGLQAGLWGLVAGSALLVGAALGVLVELPARLIAGVMAYGPGVPISALSSDLMDDALRRGGFDSTALGFLGGAAVYGLSQDVVAATTAVAAGAILAMCADTMIPKAFEETHLLTGLVAVAGYLSAVVLTKLGG